MVGTTASPRAAVAPVLRNFLLEMVDDINVKFRVLIDSIGNGNEKIEIKYNRPMPVQV
jgi:hypothetical protein